MESAHNDDGVSAVADLRASNHLIAGDAGIIGALFRLVARAPRLGMAIGVLAIGAAMSTPVNDSALAGPDASAAPALTTVEQPRELGAIAWLRSFDAAQAASRRVISQQPMMAATTAPMMLKARAI